ncbi:TPA: hypothetical protein ACYSB1_004499 [Citrobacter braakii]
MTANKQAQYESKFSRLWERYDEASHGNAEQMRDILELTLDALESAERHIFKVEKRIAEQKEYYECVIADGSKLNAEQEAREVAVKQFDDFQIVHYGGSEDYAKGYIDCQNNYNKALAAAGIGVKGE